MKKLFAVLLIAVALMTLSISLASANGGPHGGYTATTDACAGCHRAHTANADNLLIQIGGTTEICMSCHGTGAGLGADTNVYDGIMDAGRDPTYTDGEANVNAAGLNDLLGGGFVNYDGAAVTSSHGVGVVGGEVAQTAAWGYNVARGTSAGLVSGIAMDCGDCHDPHGSTNYRMIRTTVNNIATTVSQVDEGAAKDYDTEAWAADVSDVCASCHTYYHDNGLTLDASSYTHNVDVAYNAGVNASAVNPETVGFGGQTLPLGGADLLVCQTCHIPHGSSSAQGALSEGLTADGDQITAGLQNSSALLRIDNRGVCQTCHQK